MIEDLLPNKTDIEAGAGKLLISEPFLQDKSFHRSVVFLCHHDAKESVGYIVNKMSGQYLSEFVPDIHIPVPVYFGGPVGLDTLHMVHTIPHLIGGDKVQEDLYWGGDMESAIENIKLGKLHTQNCKFFIGYSGWGEGQLQAELDMKAWLVAHSNPALIFAEEGNELWHTAIAQLGKRFNPLLFMPDRPELN
jgi:putative transcriptional regulator